MIIEQKNLRKIVSIILKENKDLTLNEWAGIVQWLEKWLGDGVVNTYLRARADYYDEYGEQIGRGVRDNVGDDVKLNNKVLSDENKDSENYKAVVEVLISETERVLDLAIESINKANKVVDWQPVGTGEEAQKEWGESESGQFSQEIFSASGAVAACVRALRDLGWPGATASLNNFDSQTSPTPIEAARWITEDGIPTLLNLYEGDSKATNIIGKLNQISSTASEVEGKIEESSKKSADANPGFNPQEREKKLQDVSDAFAVSDNLEDLKSSYEKALELAPEDALTNDKEATLQSALDAFDEYVESEGMNQTLLKRISNLGTATFKDNRVVRVKAKEALDSIVGKEGKKGSGEGGGEGNKDVKEVIGAIKSRVTEKKEDASDQDIQDLNDGLKQSNAPIFYKGNVEGEIVGFVLEDEEIKIKVKKTSSSADVTTTVEDPEKIVAEVRKYVRGFLLNNLELKLL